MVPGDSSNVSTMGTVVDVAYIVLNYSLSIIGIFANLTVIIVFFNYKIYRKSFTYLLVLQQSFLDMIVCFLYPFFHYYAFLNEYIPIDCKFGAIFFFFLSASTLNLVFISIERYIAVVHPLKYWIRDNQKLSLLTLCIPLVAASLVIFQYVFILVEDPEDPGTCTFDYKNKGFQIVSGTIILLANAIIPICTMTFCYCRVYITLKKQIKFRAESTIHRQRKGEPSTASNNDSNIADAEINNADQPPMQTNQKHKSHHDAQQNFIVTMAVNTLVYSICITPVLFVYVVYTACVCFDTSYANLKYFYLIAICNNIINPFVYAYKFTEFKEGFFKTCHCNLCYCVTYLYIPSFRQSP